MLGSDQVFYQPPETLKMTYPAIIYSLEDIETVRANDIPYLKRRKYRITIMDKRPDNPSVDKILDLPYSSYDRHYKSDGLNHDVILLYW